MARRKAAAGPLGTQQGYPVERLSIAFRNGGDGFTESLQIDPQPTEPGTVNYWLVKTVTGPTDYNPLNAKGKRVKPDDLADVGFTAFERVEDQPILRVVRFDPDAAETLFDELEERISTRQADKERAERATNGTIALDATAEEERIAKEGIAKEALEPAGA